MPSILGAGLIDLKLNAAGLRGAARAIRPALNSISGAISQIGKIGAVAFGGLTGAIAASAKAASDSEAADAKLEAILKATGNAAGFSADQLKERARELEELTGISDESIKNTQALIATFKNVRGDVFDEATKSALDMSVALGEDAKASAIRLGKALQDPIRNVGALNEAGFGFTQQQKDQIKVLQESGDIVGAQNIILAEFKGQLEGVAEAAGKTLGGQFRKLRNTMQNVLADIGGKLAPSLEEMIMRTRNLATVVGEALGPALKGFVRDLVRIQDALIGTVGTLDDFESAIRTVVVFAVNGLKLIQITGLQITKTFVDSANAMFDALIVNYRVMLKTFASVAKHLPVIGDEIELAAGVIDTLAKGFQTGQSDFSKGLAATIAEIEQELAELLAESDIAAQKRKGKRKSDRGSGSAGDRSGENPSRISGTGGQGIGLQEALARLQGAALNVNSPELKAAQETARGVKKMVALLENQSVKKVYLA